MGSGRREGVLLLLRFWLVLWRSVLLGWAYVTRILTSAAPSGKKEKLVVYIHMLWASWVPVCSHLLVLPAMEFGKMSSTSSFELTGRSSKASKGRFRRQRLWKGGLYPHSKEGLKPRFLEEVVRAESPSPALFDFGGQDLAEYEAEFFGAEAPTQETDEAPEWSAFFQTKAPALSMQCQGDPFADCFYISQPQAGDEEASQVRGLDPLLDAKGDFWDAYKGNDDRSGQAAQILLRLLLEGCRGESHSVDSIELLTRTMQAITRFVGPQPIQASTVQRWPVDGLGFLRQD